MDKKILSKDGDIDLDDLQHKIKDTDFETVKATLVCKGTPPAPWESESIGDCLFVDGVLYRRLKFGRFWLNEKRRRVQ